MVSLLSIFFCLFRFDQTGAGSGWTLRTTMTGPQMYRLQRLQCLENKKVGRRVLLFCKHMPTYFVTSLLPNVARLSLFKMVSPLRIATTATRKATLYLVCRVRIDNQLGYQGAIQLFANAHYVFFAGNFSSTFSLTTNTITRSPVLVLMSLWTLISTQPTESRTIVSKNE